MHAFDNKEEAATESGTISNLSNNDDDDDDKETETEEEEEEERKSVFSRK